jgi:hypothetical protein
MQLRQDAVAAVLTVLALGFVAPAAADPGGTGPFGLGEFLKATGGGAPAAAPAEATEAAEASAPRVHKRRVAHRAYTKHALHAPPAEEHKSVAKAEPPTAPVSPAITAAATTTAVATTTGAAPAHPTPSPAPPLGPSPFLDAQSASWPPMGVTAEAIPGDVKVVQPDDVNELDLAADEAGRRLDADAAAPARTTDGRGMAASSAEPEVAAVAETPADDDNAWWGLLLMTAGGALGLGYFIWPLLVRLRRARLPA